MNDNQPTITPTFSKTHQHFYPSVRIQPERLFRDKASSSKYSAYTTSKKKLSQIHCDLHELEVKFNHFHQNLNHFMNCDNRNSALQSVQQNNRVSAEAEIKMDQSANQQLLNLTSLENGVIFERSKQEEHSFLFQGEHQPFVLSAYDKSRILTMPKLDQANPMMKKVSLQQQKQLLIQQTQLKQQKQSSQTKQKSSSNPHKLKKSKINKSYAVRNFPMEYFTNVELLYEIMNRKKHRIKHMHSEGKSKKSKKQKTLNEKENKAHQQDHQQRLVSEENQYDGQEIINESKPVCVPFQEETNFSVFETDRKLSKDTVVRRSSTSKILTMKNKIQPSLKTFIPIQKNFLNRNATTHQRQTEAKTQRDFHTKTAETHELNSPNKFRSRRMLSPKQQIPKNFTVSGNNLDESSPQGKVNFWSPQNRQLGFVSPKKSSNQYVDRNYQTKTADVNSRHKAIMKKQKVEDSLVLIPPTLRNTEVQQATKRDHQQKEDKEIKTSELDQTGIFSGDQFDFITKAKKVSPPKISQYKEEDSFLKKINQNHNKKSRYCCCCFEGKEENLDENQSKSKSKSRSKKHQPKCQLKMHEKSQEKLEIQRNNNNKKSSTYQRSRENIGKIVDRSMEKGKSVTQRNLKGQKQEKDKAEEKTFKKAVSFKSHQLQKTKSSSNLLGMKSPQRQVKGKNQIVEKETPENLISKSERRETTTNSQKEIENQPYQNMELQDQKDFYIQQGQERQQNADSLDRKDFLKKSGYGIQKTDDLMSEEQEEQPGENFDQNAEPNKEKSKDANSIERVYESSLPVSDERLKNKPKMQQKQEQLKEGPLKIDGQKILPALVEEDENLIRNEQISIEQQQPLRSNIQDELKNSEEKGKRTESQRQTFNPNGFVLKKEVQTELKDAEQDNQLDVMCKQQDTSLGVNLSKDKQYLKNDFASKVEQELRCQEEKKDEEHEKVEEKKESEQNRQDKQNEEVEEVKETLDKYQQQRNHIKNNFSVHSESGNSMMKGMQMILSKKCVGKENQLSKKQIFSNQRFERIEVSDKNQPQYADDKNSSKKERKTQGMNDENNQAKKEQTMINLSGLSLAESYLTELYQKIDLLQHDIVPSNSYPSLLKCSQQILANQSQRNHSQTKPYIEKLANQSLSSSQYINPSIVIQSHQQNINPQEELDHQPSLYVLKDEQTIRIDDENYQDHKKGRSLQCHKGENCQSEANDFLEEIIQLEDMTKTRKWFETQSPQQEPITILQKETKDDRTNCRAVKELKQEQKMQSIGSESDKHAHFQQDISSNRQILANEQDKEIANIYNVGSFKISHKNLENKKQQEEKLVIKYTTSHNHLSGDKIVIQNQFPNDDKAKVKCTSIENLALEHQDRNLASVKQNQLYQQNNIRKNVNEMDKINKIDNRTTSKENNLKSPNTVKHVRICEPSLKVLEPFHTQLLQPQQSSNRILAPSYPQSLIQITISNNSLQELSYQTKAFVVENEADHIDEGSGSQLSGKTKDEHELKQQFKKDIQEKKNQEVSKSNIECGEQSLSQKNNQNSKFQMGNALNSVKKNQTEQVLVDEYLSQLNSNIMKDINHHQAKVVSIPSQQDHPINDPMREKQPFKQENKHTEPKQTVVFESVDPVIKKQQWNCLAVRPVQDREVDSLRLNQGQDLWKDSSSLKDIDSPASEFSNQANQLKDAQNSNEKRKPANDGRKLKSAVESKVVSVCVMQHSLEQKPVEQLAVHESKLQMVNEVLFHKLNPSYQTHASHANPAQPSFSQIHQPLIQKSTENLPHNINNQKNQSRSQLLPSQSNFKQSLFERDESYKAIASTHEAFTQMQNQLPSHSQTLRQKFYQSSHNNSLSSWNQNYTNSAKNEIPQNYSRTQSSFMCSKDTAGAKKRQPEQENHKNQSHQVKKSNFEKQVQSTEFNQSSKQKSLKTLHKSHNSKVEPSQQPQSCSHKHFQPITSKNPHHHHKVQCQQCARIQNQEHFHRAHSFINPVMNPFMSSFMNPYATSMEFYHNPFQKSNRSKNNFYRERDSSEEDEQNNGQDQNYQNERKKKKTSRKVSQQQTSKKRNQKVSKKKNQVTESEQSSNQHFSSEDEHFTEIEQKPKQKNNLQKSRKPKGQESSIVNHSQLSDEEQQQSQPKRHRSPQSQLSKKAEIVNYITNQEPKPILRIKVKSEPIQGKFNKEFKLAMKLLGFIDPQHNFMKRLIQQKQDKLKLWLFPNQLEFKPESSFQPIQMKLPHQSSISSIKAKQISQLISLAVHKLLEKFHFSQSNMVKQLLQMVTGSTLFNIKSSSFNKLKNLHKHENIKGFTFSALKNQLYEIVSSEEVQEKDSKQKQQGKKIVVLKKCSFKKRQTVEDNLNLMNQKTSKEEEVVNVKWEDFLKKFSHSMIGVFGLNYQVRALHFVNQKRQTDRSTKRNFVFVMELKGAASLNSKKEKKEKQHCLINVNLFGHTPQQTSQNIQPAASSKGRLLVYHQAQPHSNQYKYIGSGDLTFISMRVKQGRYLVVLEFGKKTLQNMQQGKVIVNYGGRAISLGQEKWTNDYASMMAGEETEFIKANKV